MLERPLDITTRLATVGYFVLLPNLYYRAGRDLVWPRRAGERERRAGVDARDKDEDDDPAGDG